MKNLIAASTLFIVFYSISFSQELRRHENTPQENRQRDDRQEPHQRISIKEELSLKVENLERQFAGRLSRRDRVELIRQINEIKELIKRLPEERREEKREALPMRDKEFGELLGSVKRASFDDNKLQIIKTASFHNLFTIDQVVELIYTTSFDDSRLEIIRVLYPQIININRNYLLFDCLRFSSTKDKLREFIRNSETRRENY